MNVPSSHLPAEMSATADALGHLITQVSALVNAGDVTLVNLPATAVLLIDGLNVVQALDALAQHLAAQP